MSMWPTDDPNYKPGIIHWPTGDEPAPWISKGSSGYAPALPWEGPEQWAGKFGWDYIQRTWGKDPSLFPTTMPETPKGKFDFSDWLNNVSPFSGPGSSWFGNPWAGYLDYIGWDPSKQQPPTPQPPTPPQPPGPEPPTPPDPKPNPQPPVSPNTPMAYWYGGMGNQLNNQMYNMMTSASLTNQQKNPYYDVTEFMGM